MVTEKKKIERYFCGTKQHNFNFFFVLYSHLVYLKRKKYSNNNELFERITNSIYYSNIRLKDRKIITSLISSHARKSIKWQPQLNEPDLTFLFLFRWMDGGKKKMDGWMELSSAHGDVREKCRGC